VSRFLKEVSPRTVPDSGRNWIAVNAVNNPPGSGNMANDLQALNGNITGNPRVVQTEARPDYDLIQASIMRLLWLLLALVIALWVALGFWLGIL
jgi:hypothetical protein